MRIGEMTNCLAIIIPSPVSRRSRAAASIASRKARAMPFKSWPRFLNKPQRPGRPLAFDIASMTVGDYPDKVAAQWLVPPSAFASEYPLQRFHDIAGPLGLDPMKRSGAASSRISMVTGTSM